MTHNRSLSPNSEWALVIKAQDDLTRNRILSDIESKKLQKQEYKKALDEQLHYKQESLKAEKNLYIDEAFYFKKQQQIMKDLESQKKNFNRLKQKEFVEVNQENSSIRANNQSKIMEIERIEDRKRLEQAQKEIEDEWTKARQKRNLMIINQQEDLRNKQVEKMERKKNRSFEQIQDKLMIDDRIRMMRQNEEIYREKYEKARNCSEKKSKIASLNTLNENRDDLITRRYRDWEKITSEKEQESLKTNEKLKQQKIKDLQQALNSQLYEKDAKKIQEMLYDREYLSAAHKIAKEESLQFQSDYQKKLKTQDLLKQAYDHQIQEKHSNHLTTDSMSPKEKQLHQEILENLKENKPISFLSVPGSHINESPIRRRTFKRRLESLPYSLTPPNLNERQGSVKRQLFPDPYKHNPITNPIGSELEVFHSQNRGKSSKLAMAGSLFLK